MKAVRIMVMLLPVIQLMTGCGYWAVDEAAVTSTTAPTETIATPTSTAPIPTPTPDPAQIQREALYRASLHYLADNEQAAFDVAHSLGYSQNYGRPHDMCGPLAFKILQEAGIVSRYATLRDYWLLYPPEDVYLLERTFPRQDFAWLNVEQPINEVDYRQFPLQAGDLLFIYSGSRGDYSHVLTVTRVDEFGRAYSVTNNYTSDGFVIQEYMLYDPAEPGQGIFYAWSDPANAELGLTGFGGFDLWRPKSLPYHADPGDPQLIEAMDLDLSGIGGEWYLRFEEESGEVLFSRRASYRVTDAMAVRLPVVVLFLKSLEQRGISPVRNYLEENFINGKTYMAWLHAVLVDGNAEATTFLRDLLPTSGLDVSGTLRAAGVDDTFIYANITTIKDLITLLGDLYRGNLLQPESTEILLEMMAFESQEDAIRIHAAGDFTVLNLLTMTANPYPAISHLAILEGEDLTLLVAIFTYQSSTNPVTSAEQRQMVDRLAQELWTYVIESEAH